MYYRAHARNTAISMLHLALLGLLVSFAVAYVWQVNNQAQGTFSMRDLEQRTTALQNEIRNLNWELSSARSLAAVAERAEGLSLEAPAEVTYVHMGFSTVAAYDSPNSP